MAQEIAGWLWRKRGCSLRQPERDKQWESPGNRLLLQKEGMWAQSKKILCKGRRAALVHLPAHPGNKQGLSEQFTSAPFSNVTGKESAPPQAAGPLSWSQSFCVLRYLYATCNRLSLKVKNSTYTGTRCALTISFVSSVVLRFVVIHFTCSEFLKYFCFIQHNSIC